MTPGDAPGEGPGDGPGAAPGEGDEGDDLPDAFDGGDPERGEVERGEVVSVHGVGPGEVVAEAGGDAALPGCVRCGNSCRSVYLWQGDVSLFKERDTKKWVEFHEIQTFTAKMRDGKTFWGVKLDTPCRYLITTDDGLHGCAVYDRRPYVCRIYTGVNPDGPMPGCGFNRSPPASA